LSRTLCTDGDGEGEEVLKERKRVSRAFD